MRDLKDYERSYALLPFENMQARYRKRKILETVQKYRPRSILEIGCGLDSFFNHYSEFDTFTIVEPCDQFFENALAQSKADDRISVVRGVLQDSIEKLSSRRYDLILMSSLLHEIPDCESLLRATALLSDEATIVHLNVPNSKSFHRVLALEMGLIEHLTDRSLTQQQMQQSHTFDLEQLEALVTVTGFKAIEMGSFFVKPFTHAQMALLQQVGVATDLVLDGLYKLSQHFPEHGSEIYMNIQLGCKFDEK
jgi:2-polyprenyl-3-methyl-5-hydroxy-6-metoxy-1,4-benzoquinol methylase